MLIWPQILWRLLGFWQSFWRWRERKANEDVGRAKEKLENREQHDENVDRANRAASDPVKLRQARDRFSRD